MRVKSFSAASREKVLERYLLLTTTGKQGKPDRKGSPKCSEERDKSDKAEPRDDGEKARSPFPKKDVKEPCRAYLKGRCDKGTSCKYWHPPVCTFWKKGTCRKGNECLFAHLQKEKASENADDKQSSPPPKTQKGRGRNSRKPQTSDDPKLDAIPAGCATTQRGPVRLTIELKTKTFRVYHTMKKYNAGARKGI